MRKQMPQAAGPLVFQIQDIFSQMKIDSNFYLQDFVAPSSRSIELTHCSELGDVKEYSDTHT